jgi:hypothetical protein
MIDFVASVISILLIVGLCSPFAFAAYLYLKSK